MNQVAKAIRATYPEDQLHLLLAERNSGSFTYDGIELGGERVCLEIEEELEAIRKKGGNITKLSIVGYSLGGLVARYAIGLLYAKGVLDQVEPVVCTASIN
jgi:predicted esterase